MARVVANAGGAQAMSVCAAPPAGPGRRPHHLLAVAVGNGAAVYGLCGSGGGGGLGAPKITTTTPRLEHLLRAAPVPGLVVCASVLFRPGSASPQAPPLLALTTVSVDDRALGTAVHLEILAVKPDPLAGAAAAASDSADADPAAPAAPLSSCVPYVAHRVAGLDLPRQGASVVGPRERSTLLCFHPSPDRELLVVCPRLPTGRCTAVSWSRLGETACASFAAPDSASPVVACSFAPHGDLFLSADLAGALRVWQVAAAGNGVDDGGGGTHAVAPPAPPGMALLHRLAPYSPSSGPVTCLRWSHVGAADMVVAGHLTGSVSVWTTDADESPAMHAHLTEYPAMHGRDSPVHTVTPPTIITVDGDSDDAAGGTGCCFYSCGGRTLRRWPLTLVAHPAAADFAAQTAAAVTVTPADSATGVAGRGTLRPRSLLMTPALTRTTPSAASSSSSSSSSTSRATADAPDAAAGSSTARRRTKTWAAAHAASKRRGRTATAAKKGFGTSSPTHRQAPALDSDQARHGVAGAGTDQDEAQVTRYRYSSSGSPEQAMTKRMHRQTRPPAPLPLLREVQTVAARVPRNANALHPLMPHPHLFLVLDGDVVRVISGTGDADDVLSRNGEGVPQRVESCSVATPAGDAATAVDRPTNASTTTTTTTTTPHGKLTVYTREGGRAPTPSWKKHDAGSVHRRFRLPPASPVSLLVAASASGSGTHTPPTVRKAAVGDGAAAAANRVPVHERAAAAVALKTIKAKHRKKAGAKRKPVTYASSLPVGRRIDALSERLNGLEGDLTAVRDSFRAFTNAMQADMANVLTALQALREHDLGKAAALYKE